MSAVPGLYREDESGELVPVRDGDAIQRGEQLFAGWIEDGIRLEDRPARAIVIGVCTHCHGQGERPVDPDSVEMMKCDRCGGLGDLDAFRLREAYRFGVEDALVKVRELAAMVGLAVGQLENPLVDVDQLKRRVGR